MTTPADRLRLVNNFEDLVSYLQDELDWPLEEYPFDELTFEYQPEELGLKDSEAAKVKAIYQLRPLEVNQPWGIFFVEFERKRLPVVVLRRILSHLVVKKRATTHQAQMAAWHLNDLLFITAFGDEPNNHREIAFAHFHQEAGDLPTLRVLGWDGADTPLKLDYVEATLHQRLCWPDDPTDSAAWREQWVPAFRHRLGHVIRTADELAEALAALARRIRSAAVTLLEKESESGPLRQLYKAFQTALIHDLNEADFADTYAQTITYGLLTAAISRTEMSRGVYGTALIASNVTDMVPITNPFLREMLETFLQVGGRKGGINFDELGIQDVVDLLRGAETDLPAILRDFGNRAPGEDPVIHFYEHFLAAYDKKLKVKRGVFYTPKPVVSYIVRSVHELLQSEFGLEDGLASIETWSEMTERFPEIQIPDGTPADTPFVVIIDPATGTATFLVETINVIYQTLMVKYKQLGLSEAQRREAWNEYVPAHLLPRLFGYELMMAPYAIAHMKLGLKLFETGYRFSSDERVRVFLTNALEPGIDEKEQLTFSELVPSLAHEATAVNSVKLIQRFTVIIGNPPYSKLSGNLSPNAVGLIEPFRFVNGDRIVEKGALALELNLQDDYVKFWGLAHKLIFEAGIGVASFITNSRYLTSTSLRGLRWNFAELFSHGWFLDLGGQVSERGFTNHVDDNVFDIEQGVGIGLVLRIPNQESMQSVKFFQIQGDKAVKYKYLDSSRVTKIIDVIQLNAPYYKFSQSSEGNEEFFKWPSMEEIMPFNSGSIITSRDNLAIDIDKDRLLEKINKFAHSAIGDKSIEKEIGFSSKVKWDVESCKSSIRNTNNQNKNIRLILYRPFDWRWIYYDTNLLDTPSKPVCDSIFDHENLVLLTPRINTSDNFCHVLVANVPAEKKSCSHDRATQMFPLFQYHNDLLKGRTSNLLLPPTRQTIIQDSEEAAKSYFYYVYSILHSSEYRTKYGNALRDGFPRIPFVSNDELFQYLANIGRELVALHLMISSRLNYYITIYKGDEYPLVEYISYNKDTVWLDKAHTNGFVGVPNKVWDFPIGGYQVCHKWLKDRRGRTLSAEDIEHYQQIVVALHETIRLMGEIDDVIEEHGGWPIK